MHEDKVIVKDLKLVSRKINGSKGDTQNLNFYIDLEYKETAFPIGKAVSKEEKSLLF